MALDYKTLTHFAIGDKEGFTGEPTIHIASLKEETPPADLDFIWRIKPNGKKDKLYRWRPGTDKWVRINVR